MSSTLLCRSWRASRNINICRSISLVAKETEASPQTKTDEGWLFVNSVFPIQLGIWDVRHYIGLFREETLLSRLRSRLSAVTTNGFEVVSLEPYRKDGGVFVKFNYAPTEGESALNAIKEDLLAEAEREALPSWLPLRRPSIWLVKGTPWLEDMNRFASRILKVAFEGPDVQEQTLYQIFRPYGHIHDLALPATVPAGTLRSSTIMYKRVNSAITARNSVHNLTVDNATRLRTSYIKPIPAHAVRDWLFGHPRIVIPVLIFFLGTLTYTVFDPIRAFTVKGNLLDWFDYREYALYKLVRAYTIEQFSFAKSSVSVNAAAAPVVWRERKDSEIALKSYLKDLPSTIAFVHGPQGSGKSSMVDSIIKETDRKPLIIDCKELQNTSSDSQLVGSLAHQTGYWPVFTFLNSMNSMIDLASMGLIGQKAGLSSSLNDQLKQILEVVGTGLKGVSSSHRASIQRKIKQDLERELREKEENERRDRIRRGIWHDGRIDCIAGNGVMSELGVGDELMTEADMGPSPKENVTELQALEKIGRELELNEEREKMQMNVVDAQAVGSLPIVVIKNYGSKGGSGSKEELLNVLTQWAATLAENQIAHVIVVSDNRENSKRLAKALPSKPLQSIPLYDADAPSALAFVKQKLGDAGIQLDFTQEQTACVSRLGGRASDLESLIYKVRSGQGVEEAVEDIIHRGIGELRKNAFGDDVEDAKNLAWSREQAWAVLKQLSKREEIPYHDVLLDFPFKGDEAALRSMEQAELISIGTQDGRPTTIRAGKPVYRYVFNQLVQDHIFQATQDIAFNEKVIAGAESTIKTCEQELLMLREIGIDSTWWGGRTASSARAAYLLEKMHVAEDKIEILEKRNAELKKVLKKVS